jgi:hypothetical protein
VDFSPGNTLYRLERGVRCSVVSTYREAAAQVRPLNNKQ